MTLADKKRRSEANSTLSEVSLDSRGGDNHVSVDQMAEFGEAASGSDWMALRIEEHKATMTEYVAPIAPKADGLSAQLGVTNWVSPGRSL
ncbi:MAG: hypothetical protein AAGI50_18345 [Pseudomonadota bacterium]